MLNKADRNKMEIPENKKTDYCQPVIERILAGLNECGYVSLSRNEVPNEQIAIEVGKRFVAKGYYAKMNYFLSGAMQMLIVSANPLQRTTASKIYDELL